MSTNQDDRLDLLTYTLMPKKKLVNVNPDKKAGAPEVSRQHVCVSAHPD